MDKNILAAEMIINGKEISGCNYIVEHNLDLEEVRSLVHCHCPNRKAMDYFIDRAWQVVNNKQNVSMGYNS